MISMTEENTPQDTVEVYQRKDKKWGWRRKDAHNGQVVGTDGNQGYSFYSEAVYQATKRNSDAIITKGEPEE